jgi:hypothetical protein
MSDNVLYGKLSPKNLWHIAWCMIAAVSMASWGCMEQGKGTLQGTLQVEQCTDLATEKQWIMDVGFVAFSLLGLSQKPVVAELRIQTFPGSPTQRDTPLQDILLLEIHNPLLIKANEIIPIVLYKPELAAETPGGQIDRPSARAQLLLHQTCPNMPIAFNIQGTLSFSRFGLQRGTTIAGQFTLQLQPNRTSAPHNKGQLVGNFELSFNPPLELGSDYVGFPQSAK